MAEQAKAKPQPVTYDQFPQFLDKRSDYPEPHFVFLTSDIDPERGIPWCPDVVRSLPPARRQVAKAGGTLFQINVCPAHKHELANDGHSVLVKDTLRTRARESFEVPFEQHRRRR